MTKSDASEPRKILKEMQNIFGIRIRGCGGRDVLHMQHFSELFKFLTPTGGVLSELRISLHLKPRSQFCEFEHLELTSTATKLDCRLPSELNLTPS